MDEEVFHSPEGGQGNAAQQRLTSKGPLRTQLPRTGQDGIFVSSAGSGFLQSAYHPVSSWKCGMWPRGRLCPCRHISQPCPALATTPRASGTAGPLLAAPRLYERGQQSRGRGCPDAARSAGSLGTGQSECPAGRGGHGHGSSPLDVLVFHRQVVNGLKQRILKLEQQCKEKDNTIKYGHAGGWPGRGRVWRVPEASPHRRLAGASTCAPRLASSPVPGFALSAQTAASAPHPATLCPMPLIPASSASKDEGISHLLQTALGMGPSLHLFSCPLCIWELLSLLRLLWATGWHALGLWSRCQPSVLGRQPPAHSHGALVLLGVGRTHSPAP